MSCVDRLLAARVFDCARFASCCALQNFQRSFKSVDFPNSPMECDAPQSHKRQYTTKQNETERIHQPKTHVTNQRLKSNGKLVVKSLRNEMQTAVIAHNRPELAIPLH